MRTFLALELPAEFKQEIAEAIRQLQEICPKGIKWVKKDQLHITLQFIGDTAPGLAEKLTSEFKAILADLKPFTIHHPQIEVIPPKNPRLIWIKCAFTTAQLSEIGEKFRQILENRGFEIDKKPFKLHITLGRFKSSISADLAEKMTEVKLKDQKWTVQEATFYESRLFPAGPEYSKIATFNLQEE